MTPEEIDRAARIDELRKQIKWMRGKVGEFPPGSPFAPGILTAVDALAVTVAHYEAGGPIEPPT